MSVSPYDEKAGISLKISCNGCRILRKGCSDSCILRSSLQWLETPESQGHATVFVAKFFGRAGLMSFLSGVPENQRPALFKSLLYEAAGRTVNPVNGAVGLLWSGNWHVCQAAVDTVLCGGDLLPLDEVALGCLATARSSSDAHDVAETLISPIKRKVAASATPEAEERWMHRGKLDLPLGSRYAASPWPENRRFSSPSLNSEGSVISEDSNGHELVSRRKTLDLFV